MRRLAVAGGRLRRTRAPAATRRSPGAASTSPAGNLAGTWFSGWTTGTRSASGRTGSRGADGSSLGATRGGGAMTAAPAISGRRPARSGTGAPGPLRTSRPAHVTFIPIRAGGLAAEPGPRHARDATARQPCRTRHRAAAGDAGTSIRRRTRPAGSGQAAWSRGLPPGPRPGANSPAAATSWSPGRMTVPGRTATPTAAAPRAAAPRAAAPKAAAAGAACSADAGVTPASNPIRARSPGTPGRPPRLPRSGRRGRSAARVVAGLLPRTTRSHRAVPSGRGVRWVLATRFRRGVLCLLEVRFRLEGRFRPVGQFGPAVQRPLVFRSRRGARCLPGTRFRQAGPFRPGGRFHPGGR